MIQVEYTWTEESIESISDVWCLVSVMVGDHVVVEKTVDHLRKEGCLRKVSLGEQGMECEERDSPNQNTLVPRSRYPWCS